LSPRILAISRKRWTFDVTVLEITAELVWQTLCLSRCGGDDLKLKDKVNVDQVAYEVEGGLINPKIMGILYWSIGVQLIQTRKLLPLYILRMDAPAASQLS